MKEMKSAQNFVTTMENVKSVVIAILNTASFPLKDALAISFVMEELALALLKIDFVILIFAKNVKFVVLIQKKKFW